MVRLRHQNFIIAGWVHMLTVKNIHMPEIQVYVEARLNVPKNIHVNGLGISMTP